MNVALWVVAGLLALVFLAAGLMKLTQPKAKLVTADQGWAEDFSAGAVKGIGTLEVFAAIALVVPPLVDVAPVLAPVAASGLVLLMIAAAATHARRREFPNVGVNIVLLALALFVAISRFGAYGFQP